MRFDIIELEDLSGRMASIYSILPDRRESTLFEDFISNNIRQFPEEIKDILARLDLIGKKHGARKQYFKQHEGRPGDFMCALYDNPNASLRLYCVVMNGSVVILGNGGSKPKNIRSWQDDEELNKVGKQMMACADAIVKAIDNGKLYWDNQLEKLEGDFTNFEAI